MKRLLLLASLLSFLFIGGCGVDNAPKPLYTVTLYSNDGKVLESYDDVVSYWHSTRSNNVSFKTKDGKYHLVAGTISVK